MAWLTLAPALHVAGLQWPAAVQSGAVAPLAIEFDGGRGIRYHPDRLALGKEPRDIFRPDCTFALHPMFSRPATRRLRDTGFSDRRRGIGSLLVGNRQQPVEIARAEASQAESEVRSVEFFQLQRE